MKSRQFGLTAALVTVLGVPPCIPALAFGQEFVRVNILDLYDQLPPPPATVQEAHALADCAVQPGCSVRQFEEKLADITRQVEILLAALSLQPGVNPMQNLNPEELQRKLLSMSREEQIKLAMEMSRQAVVPIVPEPAPVGAAVDEMVKIQEQVGNEGGFAWIANKEAELRKELERKHREVAQWEKGERDRILKEDVAGGREEWHAVAVTAVERYIAAEQGYQQALQSVWREEITREKARFAAFQQRFAAIRHGQDAVNTSTTYNLVGVQQMMLTVAASFFDTSRRAAQSGATLWVRKLELDQQRP